MSGITSKRAGKSEGLKPVDFNGFATRAIHAGTPPDAATGARTVPLHQSTGFVFEDSGHGARLFALQEAGMIYSRLTNPTVGSLQGRVASLEGGVASTCTSSGHAAQLLVFYALMGPGDKILASKQMYGGTVTQISRTIQKYGWGHEFVDVQDMDAVKTSLKDPKIKLLFIESLCNPGGAVTDIAALAAVAHEAGVPLVVDNTLATPFLCNPLSHGADIVVHSLTKYISGHGNAMGGCVVDSGKFDWTKYPGKYPSLSEDEPAYHGVNFCKTFGPAALTMFLHAVGLRDIGCCMSPFNAWVTMMGMETLELRVKQHCANALQVAEFLSKHPQVSWVSYPALPDSKHKPLCDKYLKGMGSGVLTFGLKKGFDACVKLADSVQLFSHLANLGDTRSLIIHPASTTHSQLTDDQKKAAGADPDAMRLCVGIESIEDILKDLEQGLALL